MARVKLTDLDPQYQGECEEIEVSDEIAETLHTLRRQEESLSRKKRRHKAQYTISASGIANSLRYATAASCEDQLVADHTRKELLLALNELSPNQARRIYAVYFLGISRSDLARMENVSRAAVTICIRGGLKKIFLKKFSKQA